MVAKPVMLFLLHSAIAYSISYEDDILRDMRFVGV